MNAKTTIFITALLFYTFVSVKGTFPDVFPRWKKIKPNVRNGEPLFLTPLIEKGLLDEAKNLSKVNPLVGSVTSYAGFLTVNKTCNSNVFFWFFSAEIDAKNAPVVVWLQGGPGVSSLFGLLSENGPFQVNDDRSFSQRKFSWTKRFSVLYVDNPVGTGYSFTDSEDCYSRTEKDVGVNLYATVSQFFRLFPELQKNDFFVAGESYGGKYVPALAFEVHKRNAKAKSKINLKGIAMGNGFCDPVHMLNYGEYLYQIGLIDSDAKDVFDKKKDEAVELINKGCYEEAFQIFDSLLDNDLSNCSSLFTNVTGFQTYYNFLRSSDSTLDLVAAAVQSDSVRRRIHVGNLTFHVDKKVEFHLKGDIMKSVAPWIKILLEHYKVMVYNGQLDIIVAYPLTEEFLRNLKWNGENDYKTAPRKIWKVKDQIAGYVKTGGNLTEVLVRNAGHMVPADQPLFAFDLINRFVFSKAF